MGLRGIRGKEEGKKKRGQQRGVLWDQRIGGNGPSISPTHSGPVSLLGFWTWFSTLQGQRHSWAPPAALSLSPMPQTPQGLFGPLGPRHRPHPPPKSHPCLSPAPLSQGLFWLFFSSSFLLLWVCFNFQLLFHLYVYFFILPNISVSFLIILFFTLVIVLLIFSFIYLFICCSMQLVGSWFISWGLGQNSCAGGSESEPLD